MPNNEYYLGLVSDLSDPVEHPYEDLEPPIGDLSRRTPFMLERYVISKGDSEAANAIKTYGLVSNIFDAEFAWDGRPINPFEDEVYFGLRVVLAPEALGDVFLTSGFMTALDKVSDETGFNYKAFSGGYRNTIPLAVAETPIDTESFSAEQYNEYLATLVCKLVETPEYKTLFTHCFPVPKYMDLLAIYCANTFVPSLARVEDGWAARTALLGGSDQTRGGGRWIGYGKNGGMNTWRGNEGLFNTFEATKTVARQTLEAACETSYDYKDRDYTSPSEVYVESMGLNSDVDPGIKWWQWSSLRPPPCKGKEDKMAGFSPKLPLTLDVDDGYALTKDLKELAKQNFKNLVLTSPGERIMDPEFGVGIRSYLFENNSVQTQGRIDARVRSQVQKYLPYINIESIQFDNIDVNPNVSENFLGVRILYTIKKLAISDVLEIPIN